MKFLCTDCDTAMKFKDVTRPEQGSVTALFECPDCFTEIAMYPQSVGDPDAEILGP